MSLLGGELAKRVPEDQKRGAGTILQIAINIVMRIGRDNLMLVAAGVAFYAMMAVFPAIAAFVSIYGLFADPAGVEAQITEFSALLPRGSLELLIDALRSFASKSNSTLSLAFAISVILALWSAKAGISSLMTGLNVANETIEKRNIFLQQATSLILTLGAIVFAAIALAAIALLPAVLSLMPIDNSALSGLGFARWPVLAILICFALAILYRFGPCREQAKWRWITLGSAIATILWLIGSGCFSFYVSHFASYDRTYGSLAAPVILLLWFWLSALIVLLGAEIDAELEHADGKAARSLPEGAP